MVEWIAQFASPLVLGASIVMGAVSRWTLVDRHGGAMGFVRGLSAAITLSIILYYGLGELALSAGTRLAIVAGCAFVAEDILLAGRAAVQALRDDPAALFIRIIKAMFGGKAE
jgi:hypothetical protein